MTLAIVGLGFMGATHLKAASRISGLKLAVVSRDDKKLQGDLSGVAGNMPGFDAAMDFSQLKTYRSFPEVLLDREIEAVDLCLPTKLHEAFAIEALRAGKHVLVEKPMAIDEAACARMMAAADEAKKTLMVAQVLRFFPAYVGLKNWLDEGRAGEVRTALLRRKCAAPGWGPWLRDKTQSGGGVFDLLIHDIDMALYLFGAPERVSATGHEELERQIDVITAELFYPKFTATITGGWHHEGYPFSMEYTVVAENGTMDYHVREPKATLYQAARGASLVEAGEVDGYQAEIEYFVRCVEAGVEPARCRPADSARSVTLANLLLASREQKGKVLECRI